MKKTVKKLALDIITIGGATEDITFYTHEGVVMANPGKITKAKLLAFEYGAKIGVDKSFSTFGGGAANSAVNFARLGFKVASILSVGSDDLGREVMSNLQTQGVNIDYISKTKATSTGFSFIAINRQSDRIIFSNRGANNELVLKPQHLSVCRQAKWLYVASLSGKKWLANLHKIFSQPRVKIAWNPGLTQLEGGLELIGKFLARTEVFCLNKEEALTLVLSLKAYTKKPIRFLHDPRNLLKIIKFFGPRLVILTCGRDGAYAYDGQKIYHQPLIKERRHVDTTGVGDAFNSSVVAGLEIYQGDLNKALKLAAYVTAGVVTEIGAQNGLLKKTDLKKLKI